MELYFSPLACSLATRIALYEMDLPARFVQVDSKTKTLPDGTDYRSLHPLGLVPFLRTDGGELLSENAAILQYVGELPAKTKLMPERPLERIRVHQWLCFIGTELHRSTFSPLLDPDAPEAVKRYAIEHGRSRLEHVDHHLRDRKHLTDELTVADAYLFAILNWTLATPIKLDDYPGLRDFRNRMLERPMFAKAFGEEVQLYQAELAKRR
jgi:glutathione S-transferase